MLKIGICDDKIQMVKDISKNLKKVSKAINDDVFIYGFTDSMKIINSEMKFDLIFLDIEMPKPDGIEVAEQIRIKDPDVQIVYVTNHDNYMHRAYSVHAFDYLLKPVGYESILKVITDYLNIINSKCHDVLKITLLSDEEIFINVEDIIYISCGYKKRTVIVITTGKDYICKGTIQEIYAFLDSTDFFIPHRSHIINLFKVDTFKRNKNIIMTNGDTIPLSKGNSADFEVRLIKKIHRERKRKTL